MSAGLTVSGLVSGLDTASIVQQLMQAERIPVRTMESRQDALQKRVSAFGEITTRMSALRTATDRLRSATSFGAFVTTSSSNESVVSASVSGTPSTGSVSFTVDQLAARHQLSSAPGDAFASPSTLVGAGTFTLTVGGTDHTVTTSNTTTLDQLAAQVNDVGAGVSAQVLKVGDGDHRLVLTSQATGAAGAFSVSTTLSGLPSAFETVQAGQDAKITIGTNPATAVQVSRSTNSISDVIPGVTLDLRATSATAVTVTTNRDDDAAVEAIKGFVDEVNATLSKLKELSRFGGENGTSGVLIGDPLVRRLTDQIRDTVSRPVSSLSGTYTFASQVGISLNAQGTYALDESRLRSALATDRDSVTALFARQVSSTDTSGRVSYVSSTPDTQAGDYGVTATKAAQVATVTGAVFVQPPSDPQYFTVTTPDGQEITVAVSPNDSAASVVAQINAALSAAGASGINASVDSSDGNDRIRIDAAEFGSGTSFTVDVEGDVYGINGTFTGVDVEGTIEGEVAVGQGQFLTSAGASSSGLKLRVTVSQAEVDAAGGSLSLGTASFSQGIAGSLDALLRTYEGTTGALSTARDSLQSQIDLYQERIDAFELRLSRREVTIRQQFLAMENALAQMSSQGNFLAAQIASLNKG